MLQVSAQYCQLTSSRLTAEPLVMPPKSGSRKRSRYITEADIWDFGAFRREADDLWRSWSFVNTKA